MSGAQSQLVIAFDARIGRMEQQLQRVNQGLARTNQAARTSQRAVADMGSSFNQVGASLGSLGSMVTRFAGPLMAIFAGGALIGGITRTVSGINALADAAAQVGVSAQQLQAIGIAFEEAGSSSQAAEQGLGKLATLIGEAVEGGKSAQETFVRLGVAFRNTDGSARTTAQAFNDLAKRIREADSLQEQLSLASAVVGARNARGLVAALGEMGPTIDDTVDKYRALGLVIGAGTAQSLDNIGTAFANLGRAAAAGAADMVASFEPQIVKVVDGVRAMGADIIRAFEPIREAMRRVFGDMEVPSFEHVRAAITDFVTQAIADFGPLFEAFMRVVRELAPVVISIATLIGQSFHKVAQDLAPIATWIFRTLGDIVRFVADALRSLGLLERSALQVAERGVESARRELTAAQGALEQAQNMASSPAVLVRRRAEEAQIAARERLRVATEALEGAERRLGEERARARPPAVAAVPAAPTTPTINSPQTPRLDPQNQPRARRSDAEREEERRLRDLERAINRLNESTRLPLEQFSVSVEEMWRTVEAAGTNGLPALEHGMETASRALLEYGERAAGALRGMGESGQRDLAVLEDRLLSLGPRLLESGAIGSIEEWADRVKNALSGAQEKATDFWSSFRRGMGGGGDQSLDQTLGEGLGKLTSSAFSNIFTLFDKIAEGSVKAGEAIKTFAIDFAKSIAQMVAQAAAMRLIGALFPGGGATPGARPGIPGRMAGGAVAGGYTYWVGERGPELFTAPGAGRIIPNHELGGGMSVVVNQNAPGVVVEQRQVDARTVMLAVNLSRQQVASDFAESARTGHGSYAEPMMRGFAIRRRV